uniref:dehydrogenase/reductase SDR family member on chromosome X-like n=1 Tax=Myxine glutinosa TaxID=7769 RepID=UPI00358EEB9C
MLGCVAYIEPRGSESAIKPEKRRRTTITMVVYLRAARDVLVTWMLAFWHMLLTYYIGTITVVRQWTECPLAFPEFPRQADRVAVITGATSGIGYETARILARLGAHVIVAANNRKEGTTVAATIAKETLNDKVDFMFLDLSSFASVRRFAADLAARGLPVHVMVSNAGVMLLPEDYTSDGLERHFHVNFVGAALLVRLMLPLLHSSGRADRPSTLVAMASATHRVAHLSQTPVGCYSAHEAYARSKLALVLFWRSTARRVWCRRMHVSLRLADPGVVVTPLFRHGSLFLRFVLRLARPLTPRNARQAASNSVFAALSRVSPGPEVPYFEDGKDRPPFPVTLDQQLQDRAWEMARRLTYANDDQDWDL